MRRWSLAVPLLGLVVSTIVRADAINALAEASLMVEGKALLNPDGSIASYTLREPEKLPAPVIDLVKQTISSWKFQFANIPQAPVKESMTLRIVATDIDRKHTSIRVAGAQFDEMNRSVNEAVRYASRTRPNYPHRSLDALMSGTGYVLARVERDGTISDIAAEQVNLHRYVTENMQGVYRKDLADAAVKAVKHWTFIAPTEGPSARFSSWYVRVPISFHLNDINDPTLDNHDGRKYGTWEVYVRGPRETIPWLKDEALLAESPDSTPDGMVHQLDSNAKLLTPPAPN